MTVRSLVLTTLLVTDLPGAARAGTYDLAIDADNDIGLWLPDDQTVISGLFLVLNCSGCDSRVFLDRAAYQAWAQTFGFGVMATRINDAVNLPTLVLDALPEFATMSGHAELVNAPFVIEGFSQGGFTSMLFVDQHPERVIAILGGGSGNDVDFFTDARSIATPQLYYRGELESGGSAAPERLVELQGIRDGSAGGLAGAQLTYFTNWDYGHERGNAVPTGWKYMSDVVKLRYPADQNPTLGPVELIDIPDDFGWLSDPATLESAFVSVMPYADAPGDPNDLFWLPTKDAAFAYRGLATRASGVAFTAPNAGYNTEIVDPGDTVSFTVAGDGVTLSSVTFFDGSVAIATDDSAPFSTDWVAGPIGMHAIVAVGDLAGGGQTTGEMFPVIVRGREEPGGGTFADAGPDTGGGDGGGGGGGDGDGGTDPGGQSGGGGCGCRAPGSAGQGAGTALLVALVTLVLRRRRRRG